MICIIKVFPCVGFDTLISFLDRVVGVLVLDGNLCMSKSWSKTLDGCNLGHLWLSLLQYNSIDYAQVWPSVPKRRKFTRSRGSPSQCGVSKSVPDGASLYSLHILVIILYPVSLYTREFGFYYIVSRRPLITECPLGSMTRRFNFDHPAKGSPTQLDFTKNN